MEPAELDRFGGWRELSFEATGAFRVEKRDRWWLVTPDGNAFLSWGMNHIMPMMVTQRYNRDHWERAFGSVDPEERAEWFQEFVTQAFARPEFVGWNWCGWMDSWEERQVDKQHSGIQDPFGQKYEPITRAMADFGGRMYSITRG